MIEKLIILDSSMVEHSAVNRVVVGSSPTRGAAFAAKDVAKKRPTLTLRHALTTLQAKSLLRSLICFADLTTFFGSVVKRLRHRPFTAVTRVQFPSESLFY